MLGSSSDVDSKSADVLSWVKRTIQNHLSLIENKSASFKNEERTRIENNFDQTDEYLSPLSNNVEGLISALYGTVSNAIHIGVLNDIDRIRIEYNDGGTTNMCFHVWDTRTVYPSRYCMNENSKKCNGIFIKAALSKPRWARHEAPVCKLSRLDREGTLLNFLCEISPNSSAKSIMCCANDQVNYDVRYLVNEYFPDRYSMYIQQFQEGKVAMSPTKTIGQLLGKLHCYGALGIGGKSKIYDADLIRQITFPFECCYDHLKQLKDELNQTDCIGSQNSLAASENDKIISFLMSNKDFDRCAQRHMKNILNPPYETASLVHFDTHIRNILVKSDIKKNNDITGNDKPDEFSAKLIDMEFSNWGPAGADLGIFIASAYFYALAHACFNDLENSQSIVNTIFSIWSNYCKARLDFAEKNNIKTPLVLKSLFFIAYETLGWAGAWIWRLTRNHVFHKYVVTKHLYFLGIENKKKLRNIYNESGENGIDVFRFALRQLSAELFVMGFGDVASQKKLNIDEDNLTIESCNEVIASMIQKITHARVEVRDQFIAMQNIKLN